MKKIRLLLIEDNRLLRDGILSILKPHKDIEIIAASGDGKNTLVKIKQLKPNVVLLDLGLRSLNSLHVVEVVKKDFPFAKIIVMDLAPVQADILQYVKAGANGFILKDASLNDLLITIRTVNEGATVLPPLLVDSLFSQIVEYAVREGKGKLKEAVRMTKREKEVIAFLSEGMSNKEIGQKIHISTYTVKSHIHNIMEKLALHTRLEIANYSYTADTLKKITNSISIIND
ncbi:MAG: response regulator transcription factor [Ignavibacteriaceae bacterium]|nr:response regulator transcription factor [Ignavibacterium sp.]MCC6255041.1 response regulator transcription factor [Ignavibacteriaceae bacterium]HRN25442.1 response regulator transcription factor [Ignavibacteriaceae bacterium]HRP91598.1 response regulator transcription factor [Ignavibacteriaceae bacterium]HRQ53206.1 response regulator transcription factor [Ignavibacteriaceae bacterium]